MEESHSQARFVFKIQIKEFHLDTLGHVNNATYLQLFEQARWQFITENGYGIDKVQKLKKSPVVLEINLKFKKELVNREGIVIHSYNEGWRDKIGKIRQVILNSKGETACEAVFTVGFFDLEERKLITISEEFEKAITPPQT